MHTDKCKQPPARPESWFPKRGAVSAYIYMIPKALIIVKKDWLIHRRAYVSFSINLNNVNKYMYST